jgi:2-keto-myo-inositol isomerase
MVELDRFALNRILCPRLSLENFLGLTADLGLSKVELRNDLPGGRIIDDLSPQQVVELCRRYGIRIITINALQQFNLASLRPRLIDELRELIRTARSIDCPAVVLCPNNDTADNRSAAQIRSETVSALKAFAPLLSDHGITGLVEPLGFPESSLNSVVAAKEMIEESGHTEYRIVHDTFHHRLGPDTEQSLEKTYDVAYTGLVHLSGVEAGVSPQQYRDAHRGLVGPGDRLGSRKQVELLLRLGYSGDFSFEPFSEDVQDLTEDELKKALETSLQYLGE